MGTFDCINVEIDCPKCGSRISEFQSKSHDCTMARIDPGAVDFFYGRCKKCYKRVSFERDKEPETCRETPFSRAEVEAMGFKIYEANHG